jgi:secreted trypsin-like serine protease
MNALNLQVLDDLICTFKGPTGTESICSGDSGGPLMIRRNGKLILVGITRKGIVNHSRKDD